MSIGHVLDILHIRVGGSTVDVFMCSMVILLQKAWLMLSLLAYIADCSSGPILERVLHRKVNSTEHKIFDVDDDGHCYYPPYCRLDVSECNIDKIPFTQMTYEKYYDEYYLPRKPVIIQFCVDNKCDFSSIIDNSSGIFNFDDMAERIAEDYILVEDRDYTDQRERQRQLVIENIEPRDSAFEKFVNKALRRPLWLNELDLYNDLMGYLDSSDAHRIMSNSWLIIADISTGAKFHADYYATAFYNMLLHGSKYWVLIPPEDVLLIWNQSRWEIEEAVWNLKMHEWFDEIYLSGFWDTEYEDQYYDFMQQEDVSAIWNESRLLLTEVLKKQSYEWFDEIYLSGFLDAEYEAMGDGKSYYHCIQERGDFLMVPELMYHVTANLEPVFGTSQNIITRTNLNNLTLSFFGSSTESLHKIVNHKIEYSMKDALYLCAAVMNYDEELWEESVCNDETFKEQLNGFRYEEALQYAKEHAQFSDFY